jgi:hypothetical protein
LKLRVIGDAVAKAVARKGGRFPMTLWLWLLAYLAFSPMLGLLAVLIVAFGGPIKTKLADLRRRSSLRASQHDQVTLAHVSV